MKIFRKIPLVVFLLSLTTIFANREVAAQTSNPQTDQANLRALEKRAAEESYQELSKQPPAYQITRFGKQDGWRLERIFFTISKTKDGGKTWQPVTCKALNAAKKEEIDPIYWSQSFGFSAVSAREAWLGILSGAAPTAYVQLEHTVDGGHHWTETSASSKDFRAEGITMYFFDSKHGFLMGSYGFTGHTGQTIFRTTDGGLHWEKIAQNIGHFRGGALTFRSPSEGWLSASYYSDPTFPLYHTTDGGKTWSLQTYPHPQNHRTIRYADSSPPTFYGKKKLEGILPIKFHYENSDQSVLYHTHDGGKTWLLPK